MSSRRNEVVVGMDCGSTGLKAAVYDFREGRLLEVLPYVRHRNAYDAACRRVLSELMQRYFILTVNVTGSTGKVLADSWPSLVRIAEVQAHAHGIRRLNPEVEAVVDAGGSEIKFFKISADGRTYDFSMNPECAAGSGSFLDVQAKRLEMQIDDAQSAADHLPTVGLEAIRAGQTVPISGRCSVFAKSDMIHQQQKGVPDAAIVGGLHQSLVNNIKATVIQQRLKGFKGLVSFQGGLSLNASMVHCMSTQLGLGAEQLFVHRWGYAAGAIGAALAGPGRHFDPSDLDKPVKKAQVRPPLEPLTDDFAAQKPPAEGAMYEIKAGDSFEVYLGIDVGSVSTNVVVLERGTGEVLAKSYVNTRGKPIEATRDGIREALGYLAERLGIAAGDLVSLCRQVSGRVRVLGACTTGSGRFLVGHFLKADMMKNEITAQASGALAAARRQGLHVDTIFEIGGQDSKYIKLNADGGVRDYTMNKVCAAGCGSFLEEQADKLGMCIKDEFAAIALRGDRPADLGDRCTVFIESVLDAYAAMGETRENLVAGLAYSVANNYLNRVVEGRDTEGSVFFQGGTAFNRAVVLAFQKILKKPVIVTPHNEVTGAIGAALIARDAAEKKLAAGLPHASTFEGFYPALTKAYTSETRVCKACPNHCELQVVKVQETDAAGKPVTRSIFYGDRCDEMNLKRQAEGQHSQPVTRSLQPSTPGSSGPAPKRTWIDERNVLLLSFAGRPERTNGLKVGMPLAMTTWSEHFAFFAGTFKALGYEVVVGPATTHATVKRGAALSLADYCLPLRTGFGAVEALIEAHHPDYLFIPHIIDYPRRNNETNAYACLWTQTFPIAVKQTFDLAALGVELLDPVVEFRHGEENALALRDFLAERLAHSRQEAAEAMRSGCRALADFRSRLAELAAKATTGIGDDQPAFVIIGRPYNSEDPGISMDLAAKLERLGHPAIPMDFLPIEQVEIGRGHQNMYWKNGEHIICAFRYCRQRPWLIPIWITNYSCGPDSFIRKQVDYVMSEMPYLELELDEHTADAGVITRIEAFYDSYRNTIEYARGAERAPATIAGHQFEATVRDLRRPGAVLMFSNMCDGAFPLAAAYRARGIEAYVLPRTDQRTLALGKRFSSGKECVPFQSTLGDKLNFILNPPRRYMRYAGEVLVFQRPIETGQIIFFDPFAQGPCRFGMYNEGYKRVYERLGLPVKMLPSGAHNNYADVFEGPLDLLKFTLLAFDGIAASDILGKTLRLVRPLARDRQAAEDVYYRWMRRIAVIIEQPGNSLLAVLAKQRAVRRLLRQAAGEFAGVERDPAAECVDVGMFGEIYVRSEAFINEYLVEKLEEYNIRTLLAPVNEWLQYVNCEAIADYWEEEKRLFGERRGMRQWLSRLWHRRKLLGHALRGRYMPHRYQQLAQPFGGLWDGLADPLIHETIAAGATHVPFAVRGELILSWGFAREVQHNPWLAGIVNIGPFSCMPSKVVSVLLQSPELDKPVFDANYDGSMVNTRPIKIETFASQVWEYARRHAQVKPSSRDGARAAGALLSARAAEG